MRSIALVDCNNFYVSCERLFQPKLEGKPEKLADLPTGGHSTRDILFSKDGKKINILYVIGMERMKAPERERLVTYSWTNSSMLANSRLTTMRGSRRPLPAI